MRMLAPRLLALPLVLLTLLPAAGQIRAQQQGLIRNYNPGWNLLTLPAGTGDACPQDTVLQQNAALLVCWSNFDTLTSIPLAQGTDQPQTFTAPAGTYVAIGNPSGVDNALVSGADAVYTYDPVTGYTPATQLLPGQGALAARSTAGSIAVSPVTPAQSTVDLPRTAPQVVNTVPRPQSSTQILGVLTPSGPTNLDGTETAPNAPGAFVAATAICEDGWVSHDRKDNATCALHGGVDTWIEPSTVQQPPLPQTPIIILPPVAPLPLALPICRLRAPRIPRLRGCRPAVCIAPFGPC